MGWNWVHESPPRWDGAKAGIFSRIPAGVFELGNPKENDLLPGEWWRMEDEKGGVVGYGWLDCTWGEAEVLVCVDPDRWGQGAGTWLFDELAREARARGQRYLVNVVRDTHPDRERVTRWLLSRGFKPGGEGKLLRRT